MLASLLFEWYKLDPSSTSSTTTLGRYAARGTLSYLEASSILCATVFLESFISLSIVSNPPFLAQRLSLSTWPERTADTEIEIVVTTLASVNFLQLAIKTCQIGMAEQEVKKPGNTTVMQTVYPGRQAWNQLVTRYEREAPWLREAEVKEVSIAAHFVRGVALLTKLSLCYYRVLLSLQKCTLA